MSQQLRHRVIDEALIALVGKAAGQGAGQAQAGVDLAQQQQSAVAGERAA